MADLSRRRFLSSAALLAAAGSLPTPAGAGAPDAATPPGPPPPPPPGAFGTGAAAPSDVTVATIAEAEKLARVAYRPEQRLLLVESLGDQLSWPLKLRKVPPPLTLAPASAFSPLLPGVKAPQGRSRLVRPPAGTAPVPDRDEDLAFAPVSDLSRWVKARQLSSVRLTRVYLDRLRRFQPRLLCTITRTEELALAQAAQADHELAAGRWRGPLHGIPYGAKDLLDTAGIPTTFGAEPFRDRVPDHDAAVVARLREAGAVLVAKLSLGALAMNDVWFGGQTRNPWLPVEGSSGSSAGPGAAVAAGLVGFAVGSETLGSIVSPSIRCGVTGLRPTFGRVPRTGAMPLSWSLDKLGPMTRTVEDAALVLAALNGRAAGDPGSVTVPLQMDLARGASGLRVGYDPAWLEEKDAVPEDRAGLELLRAAGAELVEVKLPDLPYDALLPILLAESAAAFEELTLTHRDDALAMQVADAWPNTWRAARFISAVDLVQADRLRRRVMEAMSALFAKVDALAGPALAGPMLVVTNYTGHPSLTLRTGFRRITEVRSDFAVKEPAKLPAPARVPHGISLWTRPFDEGTLCRLGLALERQAGVWRERPPVS
ncbi:amidase [Anaeromyxobacter paludicola]|uniref:Amidase n=1 Tax=Anaeromyxobacter paludicola TaxID=2918171 RepID=A0ABM7XE92_9BACT|nr:amidase [Anaeromyxobacter paludicola]BDG10190.1 amidase [Anaeromyxobacter paludicola]